MPDPEALQATQGAGPVAGTAPGAPTAGQASGAVPGWAGDLSDRVIDGVAWVKGRSTVKVVTVLRIVVYGVVILAALLTAGVLAVLGVVRMWDAYVPIDPLGRRVWLGYVVVGGMLFLAGGLVMSRRRAGRGG